MKLLLSPVATAFSLLICSAEAFSAPAPGRTVETVERSTLEAPAPFFFADLDVASKITAAIDEGRNARSLSMPEESMPPPPPDVGFAREAERPRRPLSYSCNPYPEQDPNQRWWDSPYGNSCTAAGDVTHPDYFRYWRVRGFQPTPRPKKQQRLVRASAVGDVTDPDYFRYWREWPATNQQQSRSLGNWYEGPYPSSNRHPSMLGGPDPF